MLVAVTVGGNLFGVLGMLFSVPVCTVMYVLLKNFVNSKSKNNEQSNTVEGAGDVQS